MPEAPRKDDIEQIQDCASQMIQSAAGELYTIRPATLYALCDLAILGLSGEKKAEVDLSVATSERLTDTAVRDTPRTDEVQRSHNSGAHFRGSPWYGELLTFARGLEINWRTAEAARDKMEQELNALKAIPLNPKACERLARLMNRADYLRMKIRDILNPESDHTLHRIRAELSALEWATTRLSLREASETAPDSNQQNAVGES